MKGERRGIEKGRAEGRAEGLAEGEQKGRAEGRAEANVETARNLKSMGLLSAEQIAEVTGIAVEEIEKL